MTAPEPERQRISARPVRPSHGLSPYADAALDCACRRIIGAPSGEQEATLNGEAYSLGCLAGAGAILAWAARQVRDYDPRRPWRAGELESNVGRAFADGLRRPREVRHG